MFDQISAVICQFQRAFDQQDWKALRECLDDEIYVDYSSFRGTEPAHISADEYVALRKAALGNLVMQHNHSNLTCWLDTDGRVSATCNYQIYRFEADGDRHFHSWGAYDFELVRRSDVWKLCSITQHHLKSEGDPSVHGAL